MSKKPSVEAAPDLPVGALSRDQFFAAGSSLPLPKERVPCPEMKGYLCVSELSASRRDLWEVATTTKGAGGEIDRADIRAKALALSLWDEVANDWMCTLADVPKIGAMPATVIQRGFEAFIRVNGVRGEDLKELEEKLSKDLAAAG